MDKPKKNTSFILVSVLVGFMIAIQFQTLKKPVVRDTRDIWQLREALLKEKELQANLLIQIRSNDEKLASYESKKKQSKEAALRNTLQELKLEAGMTEVTGPGIILKLEPVYENMNPGDSVKSVSPDLLKKLLNELNMYDAKYVSIDGQRIINTTVIRDINGDTKIDGHTLNSLPINVKVVTDNRQKAEKLYNCMQGSQSSEEFFIDNIRLTISAPDNKVTIPAYTNQLYIRNMQMAAADKGGNT